MIQIVEGVYLGDCNAARDLELLYKTGITHIVNCAEELANYHEGEFAYLALKLCDPDPRMHEYLETVCAFIDRARRERGRVLVHCFAAVSRSPSLVLAYLCHLGDTLEAAAQKLGAVVWTDPDWLFLQQLARHRGEALTEPQLLRLSVLLQGRG